MLSLEFIFRSGAAMVATVMMRPSAIGMVAGAVTGERRQRDKEEEQQKGRRAQGKSFRAGRR